MTVSVLWLFLTVPWVGMQFVIVVFPGHTCLLFTISGLRGAIAFALSLHLEFKSKDKSKEDEKRHVLVTTTLIIVLFTIMFLGGATMPMMKVR